MRIKVIHCLAVFFVVGLLGCAPQLSESPSPDFDLPADATGVTGQVVDRDGQPARGAWVYAYRNPRNSFRGPADFGIRVEDSGAYYLDLVSGNYYLIARMRQSGADAGPPRVGDAWMIYPENPVSIAAGETTRADFKLQVVAQTMLLRGGSLTSGDTGFTGRLVDAEGAPMAGAFAMAYSDPDFRRMPDQTSAAVGDSGRFTIYVKGSGSYCIAARTKTRGQPIAGEPYGLLGKGEGGCRKIEKGTFLELGDIKLTPYRR